MHAHELFEEAIEWLRENYDEFGFDMERDVVWTIGAFRRDRPDPPLATALALGDRIVVRRTSTPLCGTRHRSVP
jgi:hypothetical protein